MDINRLVIIEDLLWKMYDTEEKWEPKTEDDILHFGNPPSLFWINHHDCAVTHLHFTGVVGTVLGSKDNLPVG